VTITKGISIINDGVGEAGLLVSGGLNGITVQAGPSDHVSLRGITIKGIGFGGGNGIQLNSGKSLTVENCVIRNLTATGSLGGLGIVFNPNAASSPASLTVTNTLITDNDAFGIWILGEASVKAVMNRVEAYNNRWGIIITGSFANVGTTYNISVADSVLANNTSGGLSSSTSSGHATTFVMVLRTLVANNPIGVSANATFTQLAQSTITGSGTSWESNGGAVLESFGDNYIVANFDGNPSIPNVIAKK
jgi:Right handed beta helix region